MRNQIRSIRRFARSVAIAVVLVALAIASARAAQFAPSGEPRNFKGAPGVSESSFEASVGPSPFDHIGLHHVTKAATPDEHRAIVVLYLPGTNMNGAIAPDDPKYSFPLYLASNGIDVWTLDYRTHYVPSTAERKDLSELKSWTNDLFNSDIDAAANFVMQKTHRDKLFVAGFSRGVEFAYLYAATHPSRVQGIIALDGFIPRHPSRTPSPDAIADDLGGQHLTFNKRKALMELVMTNPDGPAPIPKYKTARENLQHVLYDAGGVFGGHGGLANSLGGYSDPAVLAQVLVTYDRWWPAVQDYENPFSPERLDALKASHIPVIAFASTNIAPIWPSWVEDSAKSTGGTVAVAKFAEWGHLDVLCGTSSEKKVFEPALAWLKQHQK